MLCETTTATLRNNAATENLIDGVRYGFGDGQFHQKYIEVGYSTYLNLAPVLRLVGVICHACPLELSEIIILDVKEWRAFLNLQERFRLMMCSLENARERLDGGVAENGSLDFLTPNLSIQLNFKRIEYFEPVCVGVTLYDEARSCTLDMYEVCELCDLSNTISYRLKLLESYKLIDRYNIIILEIIRKCQNGETVGVDLYEDFDNELNSEPNCHNTLCLMELLVRRPSVVYKALSAHY